MPLTFSWMSALSLRSCSNYTGGKRHTVELLNTRRFVIHVDTFDVALHLANEQLGDSAFSFRPLSVTVNALSWEKPAMIGYLHLHLQLVLQHTVEFLDIVLQERVQGLPAE